MLSPRFSTKLCLSFYIYSCNRFSFGHFSSYFWTIMKSNRFLDSLLLKPFWKVCSDIVDMVLSHIFFSLLFFGKISLLHNPYGNFDFSTIVSSGTYSFKVRSELTSNGSSCNSSMFPSIVLSWTRLNSILFRDYGCSLSFEAYFILDW